MKWLILLVISVLVLSACSSADENQSKQLDDNDNNSTVLDEPTNNSINNQADEETEVIPKEVVEIDPVDIASTLDGVTLDFDVQLSGMRVVRDEFDEDEKQELTFSLDEKVKSAILSFTLNCKDTPRPMYISINDVFVLSEQLSCGKRAEFSFPPDVFNDGYNTIAMQMHTIDDTYANEVNLSFVTETKSFSWPGKQLRFKYIEQDERKTKTVESFDQVRFSAVERRTFKVNKERLASDLSLTFSGVRDDGSVLILLNEQKIFSGEVPKDSNLTLPREYLVDGRNELLFILMG